MTEEIYNKLKTALKDEVKKHNLLDENITVRCQALSAKQAIGTPEKQDYPIIKGKEKMVEAVFKNGRGHAFSDEFGNADYLIKDLLELELNTNRKRADFIACLNAIYRHLNLCDKTAHCKNKEPEECGKKVIDFLPDNKILLVGLQPRFLEYLAKRNEVRVIDLDPDNIGKEKFGVTIEGEDKTPEAMDWCDQMFVTGSTLVNGTISTFLGHKKPVTFYGVTISAAAKILGLDNYCYYGN